jgi:hypothetical protein
MSIARFNHLMDKDWPIMALQSCDDSGGGDCVKVELDDVVRSAQIPDGAKNHIRLRVQKKDGTEYGVSLLVSEKVSR